jgi:antitoxin ParD1/3/4
MKVDLADDVAQMVERSIASGRYATASAVLRDAMQLMTDRDEAFALRSDEMRRKIAAGVSSLRRGDGEDGEAVFDRLESELSALQRKAKA